LDGRIHLVLDGGSSPGGVPSTVVDCTGEGPVVLRSGPIDQALIQLVLLN
jgi:tRNA A37 threonylcarbamoyladenosine synthetase subunit TsaC/SUA5/YrdC